MNALRTVYRYWISIVALAVVAQIAFAGYGAFYSAHKVADATINEDTFDEGWGLHVGFGYLVFLMTLVAVVLALLARPGKRTVLMTVGALAPDAAAQGPAASAAPASSSPPMLRDSKQLIEYGDRSKYVTSLRIPHGSRPTPVLRRASPPPARPRRPRR